MISERLKFLMVALLMAVGVWACSFMSHHNRQEPD